MLAAILSILIATLPQIIIAMVGLVLVHTRLRGLHPKAYLYGSIGLALMLVNALWRIAGQAYFQAQIDQGQDRLALTPLLAITNLAGTVILIGSSVFILLALLADRDLPGGSRSATQRVAAAVGDP
jgi:hypothetical protein